MTPIIPPGFILDPSPQGGFDLFRKSPMGFVLVDSFETEARARNFIGGTAAVALLSEPRREMPSDGPVTDRTAR